MPDDSAVTITLSEPPQEDPFGPPENRTCSNCEKRPATTWWVGEGGTLALVHGMKSPWCEHCCIAEQLKHARKLAASIPELEAKLKELEND